MGTIQPPSGRNWLQIYPNLTTFFVINVWSVWLCWSVSYASMWTWLFSSFKPQCLCECNDDDEFDTSLLILVFTLSIESGKKREWVDQASANHTRIIISSCYLKMWNTIAESLWTDQKQQLGCPHFIPDNLITYDCLFSKPTNLGYVGSSRFSVFDLPTF